MTQANNTNRLNKKNKKINVSYFFMSFCFWQLQSSIQLKVLALTVNGLLSPFGVVTNRHC